MRAVGILVALVGAAFLTLFTVYIVAVGTRFAIDRFGDFDFMRAMGAVGAAFVAALLLLGIVGWYLARRRSRPAPPTDSDP